MMTFMKHRDDAGSTLVMALAYMLIVSMVVGGLSSWIVNDIQNTSRFAAGRAQQAALSSAVEVAMQSIRYTPLIGPGFSQTVATAANPSYCWGSSSPSSVGNINGVSISVWCSTAFIPTTTTTRIVTLSACLSTTTASMCASNPQLQAVVTFDDYPATGGVLSTGVCTTTCGDAMSIGSWQRD